MNRRYFAADEADAGERVDRWIAGAAEDLSRSVVQRLCDDGAVFADGKAVAKNYRLRGGEEFAVEVPDAKPLDVVPQDIPIDIVYEDDDLLVVDKPKGMVVHPAPGNWDGTLVNALLGEERVIAFDMPGTTRDAINIDFEYDGHPFTLVDTAGLRKKGRVFEAIEKFSIVKTLQAIADSNVVVLVIDARSGVAEHDAHIAEYALDSGRALVVAVNKWDGMSAYDRSQLDQQLDMKLRFLHWAKFVHISALKHNGLNHLMKAVQEAYQAAIAKLPTPKLTRALIEAVERQQPPRAGKVRPKMRYAHQGGTNPPVIVIHGNSLQQIGDSYRRYLESWFRDKFNLAGTPLKIEFRTGRNPYADPKPANGKKK